MLNYIRAECYKVLRRKYTYVALGIFLLLEGLLVAGNIFHNAHSMPSYFGQCIVFIVEMGSVGFWTSLLTGDMVFAGQYKNSTLKNEVSFGLSRTRIYLGKLIAQTLLSVLFLVVMMAFFIGASAVTLPHSMEITYSDPYALIIVGYYLASGFPLWIGMQAAACMCLFLINSDVAASISYMAIVLLDAVVQLAGLLIRGRIGEILLEIYCYLPGPMLGAAKSYVGDWAFLGRVWLVGLFWLAACTAVGLYGFHKKEIK